MREELELNPMSGEFTGKGISIIKEGRVIAAVYADFTIDTPEAGFSISIEDLSKIITISKNFNLFYKNIGGK